MRRVIGNVHGGLAWVVFAAVVAQFFLAGLGIFAGAGFSVHRLNGYLLILESLVLLVLALVGSVGSVRIGLSAAMLALTVVQSRLPDAPALIAALHPLNAVAILFTAQQLAWRGLRSAASPRVARAAAATGQGG